MAFISDRWTTTALWRSLARVAGVHLYTDCIGDAVDVRGSLLAIHASAACGVGAHIITLPIRMAILDEQTSIICNACAQFKSCVLQPGDQVVYSMASVRSADIA